MTYDFLVDTYATERVKVVSAWSEFTDADLTVRPRSGDPRGRSVHEQMVHQCVSEDAWFRNMLGVDVGAPPLPQQETRLEFIRRYAEDSGRRLVALRETKEPLPECGVSRIHLTFRPPPPVLKSLTSGRIEPPTVAAVCTSAPST